MTDPSKTSPILNARGSFALLATLAAKLPAVGLRLAKECIDLADMLDSMPLTPRELADALAALACVRGIEGKAVTHRRQDCIALAERLGMANGLAAGMKPPSRDAIKAWSMAAEMSRNPDTFREFVELSGQAAVAVIGKGAAEVTLDDGLVTGFLSAATSDGEGQITITHASVADAVFELPVPVIVSQQAALHKVAHPWHPLGLMLGDVGHGHAPAPQAVRT